MRFKVEKVRRDEAATPGWARRLLSFLAERTPRGAARPLFRFGLSAVLAAMLAGGASQPANGYDVVAYVTTAHEDYYWFCKYGGNQHRSILQRSAAILTVYRGEDVNASSIKYTNSETWLTPRWAVNNEGSCAIQMSASSTATVNSSVRLTYNYGTLRNLTSVRSGLYNYGTYTTSSVTVSGTFENHGTANITTVANNSFIDNLGNLNITNYSGNGNLSNRANGLVTIAASSGLKFTAGNYNGVYHANTNAIEVTDSSGNRYTGVVDSGDFTATHYAEKNVIGITNGALRMEEIQITIGSSTYTGAIADNGAFTADNGSGDTLTGIYDSTNNTISGSTDSGVSFANATVAGQTTFRAEDPGAVHTVDGTITGNAITGQLQDGTPFTGTYNTSTGAITATAGGKNYTGSINLTTGAVTLSGNSVSYTGTVESTGDFNTTGTAETHVNGNINGTTITVTSTGGGSATLAGGTRLTGTTTNAGVINSNGSILTIAGTLQSQRGGTITADGFVMANNTKFTLDADFSDSQATPVDTKIATIGSNVVLDVTSWNNGSKETQTVIYAENGINGSFAQLKVAGVVQNNAQLTLQRFINNVTMTTSQDNTRITISNPNGLVWNTQIVDENTGVVQAHGHFYIETAYTLSNDLANNPLCAGNKGFMGWNGDTLTKTGPGILTLTGNNTYTGPTIVKEGILSINGDARIGGTSKLVLDGGYLNPTGDLLTTNIHLADGGGGFYVTVNAGYGGQIIGDQDLVITGSTNNKKLTLVNDATSHTGNTIIRSGMLSIGADGALSKKALILDGGAIEFTGSVHGKNVALTENGGEISAPGQTELTGTISGPGTLAKKGLGTLTLTGDAILTGDVTAKEGTLVFGKDYDLNANGTSLLTEAGGTAQMGAEVKVKNIDNAGTLIVGDGTSLTAAGDVALRGSSLTSVGIAADPDKALLNATGDVDISAGAALDVSSSRAEQNATVIAANAVNGQFTSFSVDGVDQTGAVTLNDFRTKAALDYSEAGKVKYIAPDGLVWNQTDVDGDTIQSHGHFIVKDGATARVTNDIADNDTVAANFALDDADPAKLKTISSDTVGLWDGRTLTKKGEGTLALSGNNTFTGGIHILAGTVAAAHDRSLGAGAITLDGATAALALTGATGTVYSRDLIVTDNGGNIANDNDVSYSGHIRAAEDLTPDVVGDLWKRGAGVLTIANIDPEVRNHLYVGEGTVVLAQAGLDLALLHITPTGTAVIAADTHDDLINDGNLVINSGITLTATNAVLNPGSVTSIRRNGLLRVEDADPANGNLTINGGAINVIDPVNAAGTVTTLISWTGNYDNNVGPTIFDEVRVNGMGNGGVSADVYRNLAAVSEDLPNKRIVYTAAGLVWDNTATDNPGMAAHGYFNVGDENVRLPDDLKDNTDVDHAIAIDDWDGKSLTKRGKGALTLDGRLTYTGNTTVEAGRLQINRDFASKGDIALTDASSVFAVNANVSNAGGWRNAGGTLELMQGGVFTQAGNMATGRVNFNGGKLNVAGRMTMSGDWRLNLNNYKYQGQGGAAKGANAIIHAGSVGYDGGTISVVGGTTNRTYEILKSDSRTENIQLAAALRGASGSVFAYMFDASDPYLYTLTILGKSKFEDITPGSGLGGVIGQIANDPDAAEKLRDILDVLNGLNGDELKRALAELDNRNMNAATTSAMSQSISVSLAGLADVMTDSIISDIAMEIAGEIDGWGDGDGWGGNKDEEDDGRYKQRRKRRKGESAAAGGRPVANPLFAMSNMDGFARRARKARAVSTVAAATPEAEPQAAIVTYATPTEPITSAPVVSTGYVYQDGTPALPCDQDPNCGGGAVVSESAPLSVESAPVMVESAPVAEPAPRADGKRKMKAALRSIARESGENDYMAHRWSCDRSYQFKGFLKALGGWGDQDRIGEVEGFANNYAGVLAGIYRQLGREFRLGGVLSYTHMDMYLHDRFGEANDNAIRVSALGQYRWNRFFVNTAPGIGVHMIDSHRRLDTFGRTARNQRTGFDFAWMNQIGYVFNAGKTLITPTFAFTPIMMAAPAYTEEGAGTANLRVQDCTNWSIVQTLDVRISRAFRFKGMTILPELRAGWEHRYLDNENTRQAFAVLPGYDWSAETETGARDKAVLGLSVTAAVNDRLDFQARWEQKFWAEGYQTNMNAGAALKF